MRADFVIVGAGIYGLATAWTLTTRGASVLVLEADDVRRVAPADSASAGFAPMAATCVNCRSCARRMSCGRHCTKHSEHRPVTNASVTCNLRTSSRSARRTHELEFRVRSGIPTIHLEGRVRDVEPGVSSRTLGALHAPLDGIADHEATTRAYASAAQRAGATIRTGARVVDLVREDDRVVPRHACQRRIG